MADLRHFLGFSLLYCTLLSVYLLTLHCVKVIVILSFFLPLRADYVIT